jgi:GGDEF domain-containing protein/tetratricopeptide (TPR) repeat protein
MSEIVKRLERAEKYLQKGKLPSALDEFRAVLLEDPSNDIARQRAAELCLSLNETAEAAGYLSEIFDRYVVQNRVADAIGTYKRLIRLGPANTERTFKYAQLVERSNPREALEAFNTTFLSFIGRGDKPQAMNALKRMVALDPSSENYRREAELASSIGDTHGAAAAFMQLGRMEEHNGNDGSEMYGRAYSLDPSDSGIAFAYAKSLVRSSQAEKAVEVLQTISLDEPEHLEIYVNALLGAKRFDAAETVVMRLYNQSEAALPMVGELLSGYVQEGRGDHAAEFAKSVESKVRARGAAREFLAIVRDIADKNNAGTEFLEYLAQLFNSSNREHEYCDTLLKLFAIHFAQRNYMKAAECLDRATEVDAYEPGHQERLEMLHGKIDNHKYSAIAGRLTSVAKKAEPEDGAPESANYEADGQDKEPTVLEDLILQAEIFLQYAMRSKAVERLERINKLFPREEEKREKLAQLFAAAGFTPKYEQARPSNTDETRTEAASGAEENAVDNFARVTEITRNIARQSTVKAVLFATVNDVGRHWNVSRCVAGLSAPGKSPTAAMEYCAPAVNKSEVIGIARLISTLQAQAVKAGGTVSFENAQRSPELEVIRPVLAAQKIDSLIAVPLMDGEEHIGIIILEQCGGTRAFRRVDEVVLNTIGEQVVLAVNNARLRSLVKNLAVTDEKSGLLRRASYLDVLLSEVQRSLQHRTPVTLTLLSFGSASALVKEVGEASVEAAMQEIGQAIISNVRQNDIAVNYGLTTVALILSDTSDKNAFFVLDKLRKATATIRIAGHDDPVTLTAGIAELLMNPKYDAVDIVTEGINRVEAALEIAKHEGGNKAHALAPIVESAVTA